MSVSIRPNHTRIGVPQWRHHPASTVFDQPIPDMTGLTVSDGTEYDLVLPDSVWLTVMEDLQEHFARKAAADAAKMSGAPKRGDLKDPSWPSGCGQRRGANHLECSRHVDGFHVAAGTDRVLLVWPQAAAEATTEPTLDEWDKAVRR